MNSKPALDSMPALSLKPALDRKLAHKPAFLDDETFFEAELPSTCVLVELPVPEPLYGCDSSGGQLFVCSEPLQRPLGPLKEECIRGTENSDGGETAVGAYILSKFSAGSLIVDSGAPKTRILLSLVDEYQHVGYAVNGSTDSFEQVTEHTPLQITCANGQSMMTCGVIRSPVPLVADRWCTVDILLLDHPAPQWLSANVLANMDAVANFSQRCILTGKDIKYSPKDLASCSNAGTNCSEGSALPVDSYIAGSVECSFCRIRKSFAGCADCDVCGRLFCFRGGRPCGHRVCTRTGQVRQRNWACHGLPSPRDATCPQHASQLEALVRPLDSLERRDAAVTSCSGPLKDLNQPSTLCINKPASFESALAQFRQGKPAVIAMGSRGQMRRAQEKIQKAEYGNTVATTPVRILGLLSRKDRNQLLHALHGNTRLRARFNDTFAFWTSALGPAP